MESRKRQCSSPDVEQENKKPKECNESEDSFDNFEVVYNVETLKTESPKKRSNKIEIIHEEEEEEDDSFDSPIVGAQKLDNSSRKIPCESGISGFPSLNGDVIYLKVVNVSERDGCLDVECESNGDILMVYLQDMWAELNIERGDNLNIIGPKKWGDTDYIIDDENGIVVLNPDILVPSTSISSSLWCPRKIVLNDKFKFGNTTNKSMLLGTIMHNIFQSAIVFTRRPIKKEDLLELWKGQMKVYSEELITLSFTPNCMESELEPYLNVVCNWINNHFNNTNSIFANRSKEISPNTIVDDVVDIEENIWDPIIGVKGKVDISLKVKNRGSNMRTIQPLELKTGKSSASIEHSCQVNLYSAMLSSRYNQKIEQGNLLYLKDGELKPVIPKSRELKSIIQQRNKVSKILGASKATKNFILPEPKSDSKFCEKCDQNLFCSFFQKREENFVKSSQNMQQFATEKLNHLADNHLDYVRKWIGWISDEWKEEIDRFTGESHDLWRMPLESRESRGTCIGHLHIISEMMIDQKASIKFARNSTSFKPMSNLKTFKQGDICVLSSRDRLAIGFAYIKHIDSKVIEIVTDALLKSKYEPPFHLDKHISSSLYPIVLGNLYYILNNDDIGEKLRSNLIDLKPPSSPEIGSIKLTNEVKKIIIKAKLNNEQRKSVLSALAMKDFLIVEGLPGAGKTTFISVLLQCILSAKKNVLVCAFTNSAVDNILIKLKKEINANKILRLGNSSSVKSEIESLTIDGKLNGCESLEYYNRLKLILKNTPIVACTCHHVPRELLFSYRSFDYVIVDEASMVLEPLVLPVLATSSKFVLVGDCKQLTPLVLSKKAKMEGAQISTMEKLQNKHKNVVMSLTSQYRMNSEISKVSSDLFYDSKLVCGNESVARNCLDRTGDYSNNMENIDDYFKPVYSGKLEDSVVFIDTKSETVESMRCNNSESGGVSNIGEAQVIKLICNQFIKNGVKSGDIGIMSAYRKQVDCIKSCINDNSLEVNTIDSYQGREKRVIILSLTWTKQSAKKSELLSDDKRINVALTRAKQKMVLIGCKRSFEDVDVIRKSIELIKVKTSLPENFRIS